MNRKDFLLKFYSRVIKPVLFVVIIWYCGKFALNVFTENGAERFVVFLLLALTVLCLFAYLLGSLFRAALKNLNSRLSPSAKQYWRVVERTINFIAPLFFGAVIYHFWMQDWIVASVILAIALFDAMSKIIKEEIPASGGEAKE